MPLGTQAKLLRVLQNQEVQRLGSLTPRKVDVRVVAATNRNLRQAVEKREFREDLYYRLSMVEITTPGLAQRQEDLRLLADYFRSFFATNYGKPVSQISDRAMNALAGHDWPGNVRELENAIGLACMLASGPAIDLAHLPEYLTQPSLSSPPLSLPDETESTLSAQERAMIERALERTCGNQTWAARMLGVSRDRLRYRMKKYGLLERKWPLPPNVTIAWA